MENDISKVYKSMENGVYSFLIDGRVVSGVLPTFPNGGIISGKNEEMLVPTPEPIYKPVDFTKRFNFDIKDLEFNRGHAWCKNCRYWYTSKSENSKICDSQRKAFCKLTGICNKFVKVFNI